MSDNFETVKNYILELGFQIDEVIPEEEIVIIHDEERGIRNLMIDCEEGVLVLEQLIIPLKVEAERQIYRRILQMNRELVYGGFALNEAGDTLVYRNTLALQNLDLN